MHITYIFIYIFIQVLYIYIYIVDKAFPLDPLRKKRQARRGTHIHGMAPSLHVFKIHCTRWMVITTDTTKHFSLTSKELQIGEVLQPVENLRGATKRLAGARAFHHIYLYMYINHMVIKGSCLYMYTHGIMGLQLFE